MTDPRARGSDLPELTPERLVVAALGPAVQPSPIEGAVASDRSEPFVEDDERVLVASDLAKVRTILAAGETPPAFERAGPRRRIYFDPATIAAGIVTCGGLCPGLNNVVRSIVLRLHYAYGVQRIFGFRYGYGGLVGDADPAPLVLTPQSVEAIHEHGGTFLGTSRGPQDVGAMVATLERFGIGALFVLGGDGGLRGASAIATEIRRRGLPIAVVGVPKTIDNDLDFTDRTFGFATAVEAARSFVQAAHVEARAARRGVGLVKLMGRHSGFIAASATLASADVNFCLIPEVPFALDGERGFLASLERRLQQNDHAVVVVAEGAAQELLARDPAAAGARDASGNLKLGDVGAFLRDAIDAHFARSGRPVTIRYIDPSYAIRSQPACSEDAQLCLVLGQHAVHAAMAGKTDLFVGSWNGHFVHVPIPLGVATRKCVDPGGSLWRRVLESTGQPGSF